MKSHFDWNDKVIFLTGGTGSFGRAFAKVILSDYPIRKLIIFSRDETKQYQMRNEGFTDERLRYFIGDVRDVNRLQRGMYGVDVVIHAAAMKQVTACEYNPIEAIMTNIIGGKNVIDAAIDNKVDRILALSTDKAVNPVNIYGATKLSAEKLFVHGNYYSDVSGPRFSCCRYGNVIGSRGSVVPLFLQQKDSGTLTITDERMTRFWITLEQGVRFVIKCTEHMKGAEVFVPKLKSMNMLDLAQAIAPSCRIEKIGIRPGEKLHEVLISEDESRQAHKLNDMFVILPPAFSPLPAYLSQATLFLDEFRYASDTNSEWLSGQELWNMIKASNLI